MGVIDSTQISTLQTVISISEIQASTIYILPIFLVLILLVIIILLFKRKNKKEVYRTKNNVLKEGEIDFTNIIDSSFKAKSLYDKLKKVCHPDKYAKDKLLFEKATEIFSLLVKNKHNYIELVKLKDIAKKELNINIED